MAATSRHNLLGTPPETSLGEDCGQANLTPYELLKERRKKKLHESVQLALAQEQILIDDRVLLAFQGKQASPPEEVLSQAGSSIGSRLTLPP